MSDTTIELDPVTYVAPTLPYCSTVVTVAGTITVDTPCGIHRVNAAMTASSPDGFGIEVVPRDIPFINPGKKVFKVHVTIPPGTDPGTYDVFIKATVWTYIHSPMVTEAVCTISVEGHRLGALEVLEPMYRITDEDTVEMDVAVCNRGTVEDVFSLFVQTRDAPVVAYDAPSGLTVPPGRSIEVTIVLSMEMGWLEQGAWTIGVRMEPSRGGRDMANITDYHRRSSSQEVLLIEHDCTVVTLKKGADDLTAPLTIVTVHLVALLVATRLWRPPGGRTSVGSRDRGHEPRTIVVGWEDGEGGGRNA